MYDFTVHYTITNTHTIILYNSMSCDNIIYHTSYQYEEEEYYFILYHIILL